MRRLASRSLATAAIAAIALAGTSALSASAATRPALTGATAKWTKISTSTKLAIASAGLLRTADGRLHVVWARNDAANGFSLHYSTIAKGEKLVNTGAVVGHWSGISAYPRLVSGPGGGIRLIFTGANGQAGSPYNLNAMYSATAGKAGTTWGLNTGSLSLSTLVPLTDTAATTLSNGNPVAAWSAGVKLDYHVGVDPNTPSTTPDQTISTGTGGDVVGPTLARDKNGSIWAAWFDASFATSQGYYVARILPSAQAKVKAPLSGGKTFANNQPLQAVAFAARLGGGEYLAYCVPTKTVECAHVALWKAGTRKALTVPGSSTRTATHVAIAAAPGGHLWILWYDTAANKVRVVQTNATATKFGSVRSLTLPARTFEVDGLQADGSQGTLDIVALVVQSGNGTPVSYWDTQVKA
jgi:hypothetical protein